MHFTEILKTEQSRCNFIKGLVRIAKSDGVISDEESQYFMTAAASIGLGKEQMEEVSKCIGTDDIISVSFDSNAEKLLFFRECIQLCAVDDIYTENERAEVRVLAASMRVPESVIAQIESWVEEGMTWKERGNDLLKIEF